MAIACAAALVIVEAAFRPGISAKHMTLFAISQGAVIVAMLLTIRSLNHRQRREEGGTRRKK